MLQVNYIKRAEWESEYQEKTGWEKFETHRELEDWLAYNRAYLIRLEFTGYTDNREDV